MKNKLNEGWIAELGREEYNHQFGGNEWKIQDNKEIAGGPTLLINLDLSDPRLSQLHIDKLHSLPICSYINCDLWSKPQHFKILPDDKKVVLIEHSKHSSITLNNEEMFSNPLPATWIKLRQMIESEIPFDEESYWEACDTFIGGSSFIRILGEPLWLQSPEEPVCFCGNEQKYFCSIGYETNEPLGVLKDKLFFIGEAALYFFLCAKCLIVSVLSQST